MNNWGVEVPNSSSINWASEISDISFTWIIVNSQESIPLPCATKNRVLINQWGCSGVKSGVDAACFWSFLFPCTAQCPCLSSMIILHNSLIGYNWWGGTTDLELFQCNHSKMNVHSSHGLHQGSLMVHKTLIFYWLCPWLERFYNNSDLFRVYNMFATIPGFFDNFSLYLREAESIWNAVAIFSTDCIGHSSADTPPCVATVTPRICPFADHEHSQPGSCTRGARADRFICTQSQRTAASHSNCISVHGEQRKILWCILLWLRQI